MKMSKVAKMIGVDRRTIFNWVTHDSLSHLFSDNARNEGKRDLNERDIYTLNTINHLRQNLTTDWEEIAEKIEEGYQVTDFSIGAVDVDTGKTQLQQFARTLAISQERDMALQNLEEVRRELDKVKIQYEKKIERMEEQYENRILEERKRTYESAEHERNERRKETERFLREIAELHYKIGKLERSSKESDISDEIND